MSAADTTRDYPSGEAMKQPGTRPDPVGASIVTAINEPESPASSRPAPVLEETSSSGPSPVSGGTPTSTLLTFNETLRLLLPAYKMSRPVLSFDALDVLTKVATCRTPELRRKSPFPSTHSLNGACLQRACPSCAHFLGKRFIRSRHREFLPTFYFHVIFVLPAPLEGIALQNLRTLANILLSASSYSVLSVAQGDINARLALVAFFDTASGDLFRHSHVHVLSTAGGLTADGRWVSYPKGNFIDPQAAGRIFRAAVLESILAAHQEGRLLLTGKLKNLDTPPTLRNFISTINEKEWEPKIIRAGDGPVPLIRYMAGSTSPFLSGPSYLLTGAKVSFETRAGHEGPAKRCEMPGMEFIRRALQHVLPRRFVRSRTYGLLAGPRRRRNLVTARRLLLTGSGSTVST